MKLIRNLLKGASLTTALFIFQACYGTPMGVNYECASFKIVSAEDMTPLKDIAVKTSYSNYAESEWYLVGYSREDGIAEVHFNSYMNELPQFRFESGDGSCIVKDTTFSQITGLIEIKLQKSK